MNGSSARLTAVLLLTSATMPASSPFAYDATLPLQIEVVAEETRDQVRIVDLTFATDPTDLSRRARAYVVQPLDAPTTSAPSRPGILWGHWLGDPATTNRLQYLDEAISWTAQHGAVSVLTEAMWATPGWYRNRVLAEDHVHGVRQVIAFRRAMDLLLAQPGVDSTRTAFVAHDYSAMYGAIALAHDERIRHAIFIAAAPTLEDWAFYVTKPADLDAYLAINRHLHLPEHWARLTGRTVLLQFAEEDFYIPPARRELLIATLAATKTIRIYPGAGHEMTQPPAIRTDRTAWLEAALLPAAP